MNTRMDTTGRFWMALRWALLVVCLSGVPGVPASAAEFEALQDVYIGRHTVSPFGGIGRYENLLLQSETLTNATWTKTNATVAADAQGPNGVANTATTLTVATSSPGSAAQTVTISVTLPYTLSVWAKAGTATNLVLEVTTNGTGATTDTATFTLTSNWQRYSVTKNAGGGTSPTTVTGTVKTTGAVSQTVVLWGAQLEQASTSGVYVKTTAAAVAAGRGAVTDGVAVVGAGSGDLTDVLAGSGIAVTNGAGPQPTVALGPLTADWNQTGAFDLALNHSGSELKILEAGASPSFFGIIDVADLSVADKTYTFPNATGTVLTTGNLTDITGTGTLTSGATGAGFTLALGSSTISGALPLANLTDAATTTFALFAGGAGDPSYRAIADGDIVDTITASNYLPLAGGTMAGNILMGNGIAIGQTAGPLLTFDDTANELEITGGNVGIGTASPVAPLSFSNVVGEKISFYDAASTRYGIDVRAAELRLYTGALFGFMTFGKYDETTFTEQMRITNSGNVGIGTTSPQTKLEVAGDLASPYGGLGRYQNLLTQSEVLDHADWLKPGVTVTANSSTAAPNGTTTADLLADDAGAGTLVSQLSAVAAASKTYSFAVWLRTTTGTATVTLSADSNGGTAASADSDTAASLTTTWQRYGVKKTFGAGTGNARAKLDVGTNTNVLTWGAQLEEAASPGVYVRSITTTVAAGIGAVTDGVPTSTTSGDLTDVLAGSGIAVTNGAGPQPTVALGPLTADWNQTGAFDLALNHSGSELKILEAGASPSFFGIIDVADLSVADKTYTFPNATGTVLTTGNLTDITGTGTLTSGATGAGFTLALGSSTISGALPLANLTDAATTTFALFAGGAGDPAYRAIADADVPDTITAANYLPLAGGTLTGALSYSGAGVPKRTAILTAAGAITAASSPYADQLRTDGTNFSYYTLDYDAASNEKAYWQFVVPDSYTGATTEVTLYWLYTGANCTVGACEVKWNVALDGKAATAAFDSALQVASTTTSSGSTTSGVLNASAPITVTSGWAAGEVAIVELVRDAANVADDLPADAKLVQVKIEWLAATESD